MLLMEKDPMNISPAPEPLISLREAAQYLNLSERSVSNLIAEGKLKGSKVKNRWRTRRSYIEEFIQKNMNHSQEEKHRE